MKVTENFKKLASTAQKDGYKTIVSIIGAYKATTYCFEVPIERVLSSEIGTEFTHGHTGRWSGCQNTRNLNSKWIGYMELFNKYSIKEN